MGTEPGRRTGGRGSRLAGADRRPADEWSDLDVLVVAREPALLLQDADWVGELGPARITFVEPTATGDGLERRVLYDDGVDVDFSIVGLDELDRLSGDAEVDEVVRRGIRILVDKDGRLSRLDAARPAPPAAWTPPSQEAFEELTSDFWYHAVWAAKKLRRGELFTAKAAVDSYMKRLLLRALEWHAHALDPTVDTWHAGRFLEQWADPRALDELRETFARYDENEVPAALLATMRLFRRLMAETAERLDLAYARDEDAYATALVAELLER